MDQNVKTSIDARENAITSTYALDGELKIKFDELFKKIEELGKTAKDSADFEAKFASSPLNQEYMDLFTEIATKNTATGLKGVANASGASMGEIIAEGVMDQAGNRIKRAVMPTRAQINQAAYDKARDIPGVGDAMTIKQHVDFFSRFRKKKDD
ncbi:hypothetical protein IKF27_01915 [Candidatus Saccharibacteria bacterium]|nr:hypothetical protein [Candidatus Saccharibacteria bacterium]